MVIDLSDSRKTDRLKAAAVALLFEAALGYGLIVGLGVTPATVVTEPLKIVGLLPDRPPPPQKVVPPPKRTPEKEGAASPPNLRAKPTEIVRPPPPPLPLPVPPPVAAAPIAGPGAAPSAGASTVPGPGTGSGGLGNGTGSGNGGNGGGGGGGGRGSGPRLIKGRIKDKDYPRDAAEAGVGGVVIVRYVVETDGHATHCMVVRSSGHWDIDETTCRLIEQRFRYKPATDRNGRPITSVMEDRHEWIIGDAPRDEDDRDDRDN